MTAERGSLSINSENMFPIIKKWLYSDHDIFLRELVSNGCDAITKLKRLDMMGEFELPADYKARIDIEVSPEDRTIRVIDNGIGMTADEIKKYINQIAFSGAAEFLEKYKDKANTDQIIGHFGLGFYSAFMVADKVTIDTLSYQEGAEPVLWESEGGVEYSMSRGTRTERGTTIILYMSEDSYEFSNEYRVKEVLDKYCSFMPVEIYLGEPQFTSEDFESDEVIDVDVDENGEAKDADKKDSKDDKKKDAPKPVNETHPLWNKHPNECTEEQYKDFYRDVFHDYKEPLFWIHLNMDYPFNLKGILYFPKINTQYDTIEGKIKLYNNQVFIADNIKEVIPEFLMLLKGVIDCPDLPLNVSRSALQNDGFVKKISDYITKKVADKLTGMFKVDRANYEKYWDDIAPFIKFGCLKDDKFKSKMMSAIIYKDLAGKYITLEDYVKAAGKAELLNKAGEASDNGEAAGKTEDSAAEGNADAAKSEEEADKGDDKASADTGENSSEASGSDEKADEAEKTKTSVFYVTDEKQQSQYVKMFNEQGMEALILPHAIDAPFINLVEQDNDSVKFERIDADISDAFKDETGNTQEEIDAITDVFKKAIGNDKLELKVMKLKSEDVSAVVTLSEENRRMQDMMKMYGMDTPMPGMGVPETLVLNSGNALVQQIIAHPKAKNTSLYCEQVYDLARLAQRPLNPEEMSKFVERSNKIMMLLASK